ncbi:meiotic cell cortex C-terminal pleckstrin homology-domain-containing protein [Exophiala viscosa]|uniref:Meiotic cell cortex C-terminal pleckstrin homology-domain-containing protein n=1 Tax=Exophiala viscosa TaxID=2486360 RepID=A0AAN6IBU6_9EURO|nr:meiotic cell cortex C-terminal pleckstrin homology-domain-containing protein [Exophiala viscosa]
MEPEASYSLPSPADTPYRTPSSSQSSRSRRYDDMSPSSTPPPMPDEQATKRRSNDSINTALDENISPLDPRRFTPTLHASLVSEILSLRRDLESRTNDIERLEISLHATQSENENLTNTLLQASKESRSVKRQMQLLEGGTLSALSELAKERDDALNDISDMRKRLDHSQKRAKSQEETADRTQALWDKDKETWITEKRGLETKVHIAEGRLKVVLSEVANVQHHAPPGSPTERTCHSRNSLMDSPSKGSTLTRRGRRLSANSIHSDTHGDRVSVLSFHNGVSVNLADELAFDELEEDIANAHDHEDGRVSPDALPEEHVRPTSSLSLKARKVLGLPLDFEDIERNDSPAGSPQAFRRRRPSIKYVDTAIQFSPPPSPWPVSGSYHNATTTPQPEIDFGTIKHMTVSPSPVSPVDSVETPWEKQRPVMVSSASQTIEALPSPPLTPDKRDDALATIPESPLERRVMATVGTQTEPEPALMDNHGHKHAESEEMVDFKIPLITIVPPGSRPATPQTNVVLPPRTKNASTQVIFQSLGGYQSTSMQTEEIRVDKRAIVPPREMPQPPLSTHFTPPISSAAMPPIVPRNRMSTVASLFGSRRTVAGPSKGPPAPLNDSGPLSRDFASNMPRPVRTSSLFGGFEDDAEFRDDLLADNSFPEDDIFSRPTAKFVLRSGKMVSHDPLLEDIGENVATSAGEAAAMDTIRLSEDGLPPEMRNVLSKGRTSPRKGSQRQNTGSKLKRVSSAKSGNMRRAALISSGTAAHQSSHSQSTTASFDSNNPPPFPVPLRYSSAKIGKSISEGGRSSPGSSNASPTKRPRTKHTRPILRKARSGPAISPHSQGRRSRSQSPPLDPRVSIVPEMHSFQMPTTTAPAPFLAEPYSNPHEASAPRPSIATGPRRHGPHTKTNSDAVSMHQTSVVDSIAQTMVGEWMYKYVRRRKSFGVSDKADWDSTKSVEEISQSVTSNGVRHKRWVWLAPYERAVMWSSKQPTSGTALMGKSGRKLTIKSVLDVKDDNPMPKGSIIGQQFNRSILILTPQRALKFTATSQERHYVWLTALSFLSHSPLIMNELTAIPPPPPLPEHDTLNQPTPSLAGSLRRRPIRDSIRIAKNPGRVGPGPRSFTTDGSLPVQDTRPQSRDYYDPTQDPALPPIIPRHSRKRSNTAPRVPPSSFRSFSAKEAAPTMSGPGSTYSQSVRSTAVYSSDRGLYTPSAGMQSIVSSRRGSEASNSGPPPIPAAFLDKDPANTMRMDAFIDGKTSTSSGRPSFNFMRSGQSKRKDLAYWGLEKGRDSITPVDSLLHNEMMAASSSTRGSSDSRDPWRGF